MPRHLRSARVAAAIVLAAATLPLGACSVVGAAAPARAVSVNTTTTSSAQVVVAVGDSITHGRGVAPSQVWPNLLARQRGWRMTDLGINGAGFLTPGVDGVTFAAEIDRVAALRPTLIIISGSRNDLRQPMDALDSAVPNEFGRLRAAAPRAVIVAVSAIWNDHAAPEKLSMINSRIRDAAGKVHAVYIDIGQPFAGRPALLQTDDVHPTPAGQQALANSIARAMDLAHVRG